MLRPPLHFPIDARHRPALISGLTPWPHLADIAAPATVRTPTIPGIVRILFSVNLFLGVAYLCSHYLFTQLTPGSLHISAGTANAAEYKFQWLSSLFDLNAEANVPTWFSSIQLLLVGLLFGIFAWAKADRNQKLATAGLIAAAVLFVAMSLDEVAQFHENLGGKLVHLMKANHQESSFTLVVFWIAVFVPFLIVFTCIARAGWVHWRVQPVFVRKFLIGLGLFIGCAVGMELIWIALFGGDPSASPIEVLLEEVGELTGVTMMAWAAWELLAREGISLRFDHHQTSTEGYVLARSPEQRDGSRKHTPR